MKADFRGLLFKKGIRVICFQAVESAVSSFAKAWAERNGRRFFGHAGANFG